MDNEWPVCVYRSFKVKFIQRDPWRANIDHRAAAPPDYRPAILPAQRDWCVDDKWPLILARRKFNSIAG